jgi:hypothetical protein
MSPSLTDAERREPEAEECADSGRDPSVCFTIELPIPPAHWSREGLRDLHGIESAVAELPKPGAIVEDTNATANAEANTRRCSPIACGSSTTK